MAHHDDGPSENCVRCGEWFRDEHECYGKPSKTIAYFFGAYGYGQVKGWLDAAREAENARLAQEEYAKKIEHIKELQNKVNAGKEAQKELDKLDNFGRPRNTKLAETDCLSIESGEFEITFPNLSNIDSGPIVYVKFWLNGTLERQVRLDIQKIRFIDALPDKLQNSEERVSIARDISRFLRPEMNKARARATQGNGEQLNHDEQEAPYVNQSR